ncbi:MAG: SusC/RagA family TonB-linked outer membrane protein, partial [Bacteroidetes bacterium]|nr:SusC/RagA family TonB-linked outer membrane protein [Bacteroidota bacterium]
MRKELFSSPLCRMARCGAAVYLLLLNGFPADAQVAFTAPRYAAFSPLQKAEVRLTLFARNDKLSAVLERIEKQSGYVFVYSNDEVNVARKVSLNVKDKSLAEVLQLLLQPLSINFEILNDKIILKQAKSFAPLQNGGNHPAMETTEDTRTIVAATAFAVLNGRVTDDKGVGLANVSVTVKGTDIGTVTGPDGRYTLRVPDEKMNGVLVFSSVGFVSREVSVDGRSEIDIRLTAESKDLNEVIVVGYGTQRKVSVTGSVDAIGRKAIEGRPVTNLSTALQGTSPNLIIQQRNFEPGQPVNINIRGLGTLGDNSPLVVIDGIIGGDINLVNPNDIESVSILRDAGSAAIYGSRSANGVILITTKKGKKNEKPTISYGIIYGTQVPRVTYKPVHAWENAYYKNESLVNSGLAPAFTPADIQSFAARGDGDWRVDNIVHNALQQTHNLSISGGSATSTYLLSFGILDQQNNFIGPDYGYKRYNVRLNQTSEIGRLKINTILSYVKVLNKDHSFNAGTLIVDASRVPLYYSFTDSAGHYLTNPVSAQFNPKGILEKGGYRKSDNDEIFGNFNAELAITKDLKLRGVFGGTVRNNQTFGRVMQVNFLPGGVYGDNREVSDANYKSLFSNLQLLAEYTKSFKQHDIHVLVGAANESVKEMSSALYQTKTDSALGVPTTGTLIDPSRTFNSNGTNLSNGRPATIESSINSVFGRVNYSFSDKYFAEFDFRYDGASKFAKENRWGFFPSVSAAWLLTEEGFAKAIKEKIGDFKIRASYGMLGNQNVNAYQYQTTFFNYTASYGFNNSVVGGSGYTLGNPDLTWEKAATFNAGVDATLLNRRLYVSFDIFDKTTRDILYTRKDVPQLFGAGFPDYNVAKVRNRGWEMKATYTLPGRMVTQTFSVNLADNLNELLALTSGATEQVERKEEFELVRRVGQPITVYQGYKRNGYFQNLNDINKYPKFAGSTVTAGDIKFVDKDGNGVIDDKDKFILGNPFPRYTFGFTYTAAAKGFDLMLFVQGVGKRDAMIRGEQVEPFHFGYGGTMYTHQTDYWTPTNPNAKYPRLAEAGSTSNTNNYRTGSDLFLFNAAYARL